MKKFLSAALAASLILTMGTVFASAAQTAPEPSQKSAASAANVTEIASAEDFAKITDNLGGSYKLTADITLTTGLSYGDESKVFTGVFDGNGKTITVDFKDTDQRTGVFCTAGGEGCTIKNLTVVGTITSKGNSCGGVVGTAKGPITFEGVTSKVTITCAPGHDAEGSSGIGGILGVNEGCTVTFKDCTSLADVTGIRSAGGFIGLIRNAGAVENFEGCTFNGKVRCTTEWSDKRAAGGYIGIMHHNTGDEVAVSFKNCKSDGEVTSDYVLASAWVGSYARFGHPDSLPTFDNCTQTAKVTVGGYEISKINDTRYPEGMDNQTSGRMTFDAENKTLTVDSNLAMNANSVKAAVESGTKVYVNGVLDETATVTISESNGRNIIVVSKDPTVKTGEIVSVIVVFGNGHFTTLGQSVEVTWEGNTGRLVTFDHEGVNAHAEDVQKNLSYTAPVTPPTQGGGEQGGGEQGGGEQGGQTPPPTGSASVVIATLAVISLAGVAVAAKARKKEQD